MCSRRKVRRTSSRWWSWSFATRRSRSNTSSQEHGTSHGGELACSRALPAANSGRFPGGGYTGRGSRAAGYNTAGSSTAGSNASGSSLRARLLRGLCAIKHVVARDGDQRASAKAGSCGGACADASARAGASAGAGWDASARASASADASADATSDASATARGGMGTRAARMRRASPRTLRRPFYL